MGEEAPDLGDVEVDLLAVHQLQRLLEALQLGNSAQHSPTRHLTNTYYYTNDQFAQLTR